MSESPKSYALHGDRFFLRINQGFTFLWTWGGFLSFAPQEFRHGLPEFSNLEHVDDEIGERIAIVQKLCEVNQLENITVFAEHDDNVHNVERDPREDEHNCD